MEIPKTGRAVISEGFDSVQITVPAKKNYLVLITPFVGVTAFFLAGGTRLFKQAENDQFSFWFFIFWIIAVLWAALKVLLWTFMGKEIIEVQNGILYIQRKGDLFSKSLSYDLSEASCFRAEENNNSNDNTLLANFTSNYKGVGTICFEYGIKTIRFGEGLSQAEGNYILQKLKEKKILLEKNFQ